MNKEYQSFKSFYPFYLREHSNRVNRRLHFVGSSLVLVVLLTALILSNWWLLLFAPIVGYGFAWVGHYFFECNKPATFTYPLYSLMGDWVMYKDILVGNIKF